MFLILKKYIKRRVHPTVETLKHNIYMSPSLTSLEVLIVPDLFLNTAIKELL